MAPPVIALLTDFGLRDHYVGTMKGVILGICPVVTLVDVSHDVPAHDILAGAFELAASFRFFPGGTVFLVVVDPGVGSARQGIAAVIGDYTFVAPNNGVLSVVLGELPVRRAVELAEPRYSRPIVSRTFEGRDRFAPAAAWLAAGIELDALGPPIGALHHLEIPKPVVEAEAVVGQVLRVDRFGNLISNIDREAFDQLGGDPLDVQVGTRHDVVVVSTYADVAPGNVCALFGSTGHLEIAANGTSAAALLDLERGASVRLIRRA